MAPEPELWPTWQQPVCFMSPCCVDLDEEGCCFVLGKGMKRDPTGIWLTWPCRCTFLLLKVGALRYDIVSEEGVRLSLNNLIIRT